MAVPVKKKFKHYRGDDFRYTFRVDEYVNPDDTSLGTQARDLTGWTANASSEPDVTVTLSAPDATGVITVNIPAADLGDGQEAVVLFDVQLVDTSGFKRTYLSAQIGLVDQVA